MKAFILCLCVAVSYAAVSTIVTVNKDSIDARKATKVVLPCEYQLLPEEDQPPIIYWIKGVSVDDADAVVIFKGFRYWNESLGEYRQFFNGYEKRASVADLEIPSLTLIDVEQADEGRYWCMVAEWSGRQQAGTDADSVALLTTTDKYVDVTTTNSITINEFSDVTIDCNAYGDIDMVTWKQGPYHLPDSENFTHTEIGSYNTIGIYDLVNDEELIDPEYTGVTINSNLQISISNASIHRAGRYWCEVTKSTEANTELHTARASTILSIEVESFVCAEGQVGTFPDPADCSMYYECAQGNSITYHRSCGYDGLVYHEAEGYCDWAANVPPPCGTKQD